MNDEENQSLEPTPDSSLLNHDDLEFERQLRGFQPRGFTALDIDFIKRDSSELPTRKAVSQSQLLAAVAVSLMIGLFVGGATVYFANPAGVGNSSDVIGLSDLDDSTIASLQPSSVLSDTQDVGNSPAFAESDLDRSSMGRSSMGRGKSDVDSIAKQTNGLVDQFFSVPLRQRSELQPFASLVSTYSADSVLALGEFERDTKQPQRLDSIEELAPHLLKRLRSGRPLDSNPPLSVRNLEEFL